MLWSKQRDWGSYFTLLRLPWLCLKILRFKPKGELSYQKHNYRNEWWLFLNAFGHTITDGQVEQRQGISMWLIRNDVWHKYINLHRATYVIEIQWGWDVSEIDIERTNLALRDVMPKPFA